MKTPHSEYNSRRKFAVPSLVLAAGLALASVAGQTLQGAARGLVERPSSQGPQTAPHSFQVLVDDAESDPLVNFAAQQLSHYIELLGEHAIPVIATESWLKRPTGTPIILGKIGQTPLSIGHWPDARRPALGLRDSCYANPLMADQPRGLWRRAVPARCQLSPRETLLAGNR
jgi:hypothetical protein